MKKQAYIISVAFFFNRDEENVYLPLSGAFHKFALPETARQFASGYGEKHKIYSQQHSDRTKEVRQDFHVTCRANRTDLKFCLEDQKILDYSSLYYNEQPFDLILNFYSNSNIYRENNRYYFLSYISF